MNADPLICAVLLLLSSTALHANDTLETTFRTHGPRMNQLVSDGPTKVALQQSSAVIQKGRSEMAYGVVISPDGYILTKASEVPDLTGVSVAVDQQLFKSVRLVATDPRWDVALLKVDATGLSPVRLATGPELERGTWVVANGTTTRKDRNPQIGVISATAREIKEKDGVILGIAFDDDDGDLAVSDLADDGEAKKAGFEIGDVLISIEDRQVKDLESLVKALAGHPVGATVAVNIKREGQPQTLSVMLGELLTRNDDMSGFNRSGRRSGFPRVIQHDIIADYERMGGPVFDLDGSCVGMNIARPDRCETYAIPAEELKSIIEEMLAKAKSGP
ncbi:MAG: serine protease [Akkermansiaceae bacterium]|nr:serine protease [Akkermansiaceae bacterium]